MSFFKTLSEKLGFIADESDDDRNDDELEDGEIQDEEDEGYEPDLITLEDEEGKEHTFEVIDATEVNGTRYLAVIPYQEDPESLQEDAELILMRIGTDDEGEYMDVVEDDEEFYQVSKQFEERLNDLYDIQ